MPCDLCLEREARFRIDGEDICGQCLRRFFFSIVNNPT